VLLEEKKNLRPAEIMVEGLISFVFSAIKKRRATRKTMHYDHLSSLGSPPTRGLPERFTGGGASYNAQATTQSCRFVVAPSLADELDLWRGDDAGRAPRQEGLLQHAPLFPTAAGDGREVSRSRRFGSMRL
jgi:hypothetical protein